MTLRMGRVAVVMLVGALFLLTASVASATPTGQLFLDPAGSLAAGCAPGCPFADVNITLSSNEATVVFSTPATGFAGSGGFRFLLGGVGEAGGPKGNIVGLDLFDINGTPPSVTVDGIVPVYALGSSADTSGVHAIVPPSTQSIDGVGSYNLILTWGDDSSHGSKDLLSSLTFVVHNTSDTWGCILTGCSTPLIDSDENFQTSWTNSITGASSFSSDSWAMAHLSRCFTSSLPSSCGNTGVVTAWAGGAQLDTNVPESGTLALFGTGLLLLGTLGRRVKK